MKRITRNLLTTAAISALLVTGTFGTAAASTELVDAEHSDAKACTAKGKDIADWKYYKAFKKTVNIRSGRSSNCVAVGTGSPSHKVDIHCGSGNWTYLRDVNTGVKGWVYDKHIDWGKHTRLPSC